MAMFESNDPLEVLELAALQVDVGTPMEVRQEFGP